MKSIKLMNKIAKVGTDVFDKEIFTVSDAEETPDAIMVRSASLHEMDFPATLSAIARAGAGVNNIPIDKCTEQGIVVFNTPGANANGVKELAICALILASRDVVGGANWAESLKGEEGIAKLVEKGKSAYAGTELLGKTLGVIGLGAIGGMVANAAAALGMKVMGYDAYISPSAAWKLSPAVKEAKSYEEIYKNCDYITLHVPSTPTTKNMICKDTIALMKDGVRIINLARADLVCADDIKAALDSGKVKKYVTDFPTGDTVGVKGILNIPHLGASTEEAEDNCAVMAAEQLRDYLLCGNIKNSVNFPNLSLECKGEERVCVAYKNSPEALSLITAAFAKAGAVANAMGNATRGELGYVIADTDFADVEKIKAEVLKVSGVISVKLY